ncbi:unnamed protein product, partial [Adineta ricciae]
MSSYAPDQCSICRTSLNSKEFDEITTSCGHTFHRECAQKRLERYNKTDCQVCRRERALGDALSRQKITPPETVSYSHLVEGAVVFLDKIGEENKVLFPPLARMTVTTTTGPVENVTSSTRSPQNAVIHVVRIKVIASLLIRSLQNYVLEDHNNLTRDNRDFRTCLRPSSPPRTQSKEIVYVVNLPSDIKDDFDLTNLVRTRMENSLQIPIRDIKCYCKLGIGTIQVADRQTKNRLVQSIQEITLNVGGKSNTIKFVDTLELTSFVVLEMNKDLSYPSTKEINVRWKDLYGGERPRSCEQFDRY